MFPILSHTLIILHEVGLRFFFFNRACFFSELRVGVGERREVVCVAAAANNRSYLLFSVFLFCFTCYCN